MPKRTDIQSIMIIGAGPIVIGQACEFDYSGAQACKALREEGYRVILVNSNPATIMTDPGLADATYIEPITPDVVASIIARERPDALLPTMGGQTGLNTALALDDMGVLARYGVELIGAKRAAIEMAEDRKLFREAMDRLGIENPKAVIVAAPKLASGKFDIRAGMADAMDALEHVGLPAIIRPAFTLGGTGGGVAYNRADYERICRSGLEASPMAQILVDESLLGWKEFEMEVVRDRADNAIIVCSIENLDPMGVHTGDSITVAPALTLTDREFQDYRSLYVDLYQEFRRERDADKESINDDVVFEIELIKQIEVNVDYVLMLVEKWRAERGNGAAAGHDLGASRDAIAKALAIDPEHRKALWLRASLELQEGRYSEAARTWRHLQGLVQPGSPDARVIAANIEEANTLAASARQGG